MRQLLKKKWWCSAVMILMFVLPAKAQKGIPLALNYKKGDQERIMLTIDQEIMVTEKGEEVVIYNKMKFWLSQKCLAVLEDGHFKMEQAIQRISLDMVMFGEKISIDSKEEPAEITGEAHEVWESLVALEGMKSLLIIAPSGKVISSDNHKWTQKALNNLAVNLEMLNMIELPTKAPLVKLNYSWDQIKRIDLQGLNTTIVMDHTLSQYDEDIAEFELEGRITNANTENLILDEGTCVGKYTFDTKRGCFRTVQLKLNMEMKNNGVGNPITVTQKITARYYE